PTVKLLTSVPGIDAIRAVTIASLICSPHRFLNKHKLWSYSMLVRHTKISDGKAYGTQNRYGRSDLKGRFYGSCRV
ncbi:MAG: transposase, partial [Bdellovibrionales bacterium]|nr:transposase [Bdellovibrionales bacterium]